MKNNNTKKRRIGTSAIQEPKTTTTIWISFLIFLYIDRRHHHVVDLLLIINKALGEKREEIGRAHTAESTAEYFLLEDKTPGPHIESNQVSSCFIHSYYLLCCASSSKSSAGPPDSCATWSIHFRELNASQPHTFVLFTRFSKKKKKSRLYRDIARSNWRLEIYLCVSIYFAMMQKTPAQKLIPSPIYIDLFHLSLTVRINKGAPIFCIFLLLFCRFDVCLFVCFLLSVWDLSIKEFSI
jgi:hypothetical protein